MNESLDDLHEKRIAHLARIKRNLDANVIDHPGFLADTLWLVEELETAWKQHEQLLGRAIAECELSFRRFHEILRRPHSEKAS